YAAIARSEMPVRSAVCATHSGSARPAIPPTVGDTAWGGAAEGGAHRASTASSTGAVRSVGASSTRAPRTATTSTEMPSASQRSARGCIETFYHVHMADSSFDIVSKVDKMEAENAVN